MKKTNLFFLLSFFIIIFLAGCGVNNPSGGGFSPANVAPGNAALSMTVNFPKKPVSLPAGLMGLLSPNTQTIEIHISGGSVYNSAAVIASTSVVAPFGGGPATANIVLTNPATSVISVEIVAKDTAGNWLGEVRELNKPLSMGGTVPINATMVELNQGIDMIAMGIPATSRPVVYAPDGTAYTVNKVILQSMLVGSTTVYSMIAETDKKTTGGATTLNVALTTASGALAVRTDPFVANGLISGTFAFSNFSAGAKDYIFTLDFSGLNNIPNLTIVEAPGGLFATAPLNPVITQQWANNISPTVLVQMGGAKQGRLLVLSNTVTSLTGNASTPSASGAVDGAAVSATFNQPAYMTTDGTNLYISDEFNHKIRQVSIATGAVSSLTGAANTTMVSGAADGTATAATFYQPRGITTDGTNLLYVSDTSNHKIRKINIATGIVSSLTGSASTPMGNGAADGPVATATFDAPCGITTDGTNLYVADSANNKIRKIVIATGVVSSLTGTANASMAAGATDGPGVSASFNSPYGITTDGTNLYVADVNNNKIRKIVIATGAVSTIAGTGVAGATDGAGTTATFYLPFDITTDGTNLYVSDNFSHKIRKIVIATGVVSTIAGVGTAGALDGTGTGAGFNRPYGITTDGANLYVAEWVNNKIRKIQ